MKTVMFEYNGYYINTTWFIISNSVYNILSTYNAQSIAITHALDFRNKDSNKVIKTVSYKIMKEWVGSDF